MDSWRWIGNNEGKFRTKEMYEVLFGEMIVLERDPFPYKKPWWKAVPLKVSVFHGKLFESESPPKKIC